MQHAIAASLRRYRRAAPASPAAQRQADRVISGTAWRVGRHQRWEHQRRMEQWAEIQQLAASPRVPTRQQQQQRDIERWLREAGL